MWTEQLVIVTAEHSKNGIMVQCTKCPFALAIKDFLPNVNSVVVGPGFGFTEDKQENKIHMFILSEEANQHRREFDSFATRVPPGNYLIKFADFNREIYDKLFQR